MSMNTDWWEHFNRDHVELVCVKQDPIEQIVKEGVLLESGRIIEADVIVLCTGNLSIFFQQQQKYLLDFFFNTKKKTQQTQIAFMFKE